MMLQTDKLHVVLGYPSTLLMRGQHVDFMSSVEYFREQGAFEALTNMNSAQWQLQKWEHFGMRTTCSSSEPLLPPPQRSGCLASLTTLF